MIVASSQHAKKKLGKKLLPANSTATHFRTAKVQLPSQRALSGAGGAEGVEGRVRDLVALTSHHSPVDRRNALRGTNIRSL